MSQLLSGRIAAPGGRRTELADFLRVRRERLTPSAAGLPAGAGLRRTRGLRREEVAVLAGVSVTWYTWLEQGRPVNPSESVLRAIARTLQLTDDETAHLFELARPAPRPNSVPPARRAVQQQLQELVDAHTTATAVLIDARWDLIAWNPLADAVWNFSQVPEEERNLAWLMFHPWLRERLADWPLHGRRVVAELRSAAVALDGDRRFGEVLDRLRTLHPQVETWWQAHEIRKRVGEFKEFNHPEAGMLRLQELVLNPASAPEMQLLICLPDGPGTADRLAQLLAGA